MKKIVLSFCSQHGRRVGQGLGEKGLFGFSVQKKKSFSNKKTWNGKSFDSLFRPNNEEINGMNLFWEFNILFRHCSPLTGFQCRNTLYMYGMNELLHGCLVCTIFIMYYLL